VYGIEEAAEKVLKAIKAAQQERAADTSPHESYENHYPKGFELEWVDDPDNHLGVKAAYARNQKFLEEKYKKLILARLGDQNGIR